MPIFREDGGLGLNGRWGITAGSFLYPALGTWTISLKTHRNQLNLFLRASESKSLFMGSVKSF
jgi:hypothetical protein